MAIASVLGMELVMPIGTTAPFSAISGVDTNAMSLLCAEEAAPKPFSASSSDFASNAPLFHACAAASPGFNQPAAISSA
jgi:hypothetical protein